MCIDHESIDKMSFQKEMTEMKPGLRKRVVTNDQQNQLKQKLLQYRNSLLPSSTAEFIPVASTGIFLNLAIIKLPRCCRTVIIILPFLILWTV